MGWPLQAALTGAAFLGHLAIAVWLFNRLHALPLPRWVIKVTEKALLTAVAAVVAAFAIRWLATGDWPVQHRFLVGYAGLCWIAAAAAGPMWLLPKLWERQPAALASNDTRFVDVVDRLGFAPLHGAEFRLWSRFPGNEMLHLAVQEKTLLMPALPSALAGLRIAHLSDLHMTGQVGREFYEVIVAETNALAPDVVVITGDIVENAACLSWIAPTLGCLQAQRGKFFILGNHELRLPDPALARAALAECGFADLGGKCEKVCMSGASVLFAGTELPWFGAAPRVALHEADGSMQNAEFRILLSHSPDQLPWARANQFDLMLAGHNHGGQIRLPYLGALIAPSWYGFRYAGGVYAEPPTLLHVSRGLGGIHPIRLNCPPELALLVLQPNPGSAPRELAAS